MVRLTVKGKLLPVYFSEVFIYAVYFRKETIPCTETEMQNQSRFNK